MEASRGLEVLTDLSIHQLVSGDSWGAVKDVLIVSPIFFF